MTSRISIFLKIPMFLHRFMGFGGSIAGVILFTLFSEWMDTYELKKKILLSNAKFNFLESEIPEDMTYYHTYS